MRLMKKVEKDPFTGQDITIFADIASASVFHKGMLRWLITEIKRLNETTWLNEDNELVCLVAMNTPQTFKVHYRLLEGQLVKGLHILTDGHNFQVLEDISMND